MSDDPSRPLWGHGLHVASGAAFDPAAYDRYLGRWSRLFVPDLVDAAGIRPDDRVLDVATGPGDAAVAAAAATGRDGLVVGCDIAAAMATTARRRVGGALIPFAVADATGLAFGDATFDAVICQLGLMFFADRRGALAEFRRVLVHGGRVAVSAISTPDRAPMWGLLAEALSNQMPTQRDVLQLSFSLADASTLTGLLGAAGFTEVEVRRVVRAGTVDSLAAYWEPIVAGAALLPVAYRSLAPPARRQVRDEVEARLAEFLVDGRLEMSLELLIATGHR